MDSSQNNVNVNISLAQFTFHVQLHDSYTTDYYEIAYPGLIMSVGDQVLQYSDPNSPLQLHLTRQIGYYIVQTYIPSTVFVVSFLTVSG